MKNTPVSIHSDGEDIIISRELLEAAADFPYEKFGGTDVEYAEEFRRSSSEVYRLDVPRPMSSTGYCFVYALLGKLEPGGGEGIDIEFRSSVGGDAIRSVLIRREGEDLYRMELVFDMGNFDRDRPLVLANDVDFETAAGIVKRLGVYGQESESIEEIYNGFKSLS